jgi:glycosyltransferase involved in cell wall biosynthesis
LMGEIELQSTAASRHFVILGAVDETTLSSLYARARALLFPSHYEGWGLPVREAAIRGCPVVAGDCPALREAGAEFEAVVFLSTDDPEPWASHMRRPPEPVEPAMFRPWRAFAADLLARLDSLASEADRR